MMVQRVDDRTYLERRAEDELGAAQEASHPAVVRAHFQMASLYLDRLYRMNAEPGDQGGTPTP